MRREGGREGGRSDGQLCVCRINGKLVKYGGSGAALSDGDVIELGTEEFIWQADLSNN